MDNVAPIVAGTDYVDAGGAMVVVVRVSPRRYAIAVDEDDLRLMIRSFAYPTSAEALAAIPELARTFGWTRRPAAE